MRRELSVQWIGVSFWYSVSIFLLQEMLGSDLTIDITDYQNGMGLEIAHESNTFALNSGCTLCVL